MFENNKMGQETWMESLARFRTVFGFAIERAREIEDEGYGSFTFFQTESVESLLALETYIGFSVPNSLKDLLLTNGPLQIGNKGSKTALELYCLKNHQCQTFKKFWELIDEELIDIFGGFFTASEIDELNKKYFIFGEIFLGNDNYEYLYFTSEGHFGTLIIYHDDDSGPNGLRQMIDGGGNFFGSLDELFSYCMNLKIDTINEWMQDHEAF